MSFPIFLKDDPDTSLADKLNILISDFPMQKYDELLGLFPTISENYFMKSLSIVQRINLVKVQEYMEEEFYIRGKRYQKMELSDYWTLREKYISSLDFIRMLINSTDDDGYLINDISYICKGWDPCTVFFECNQVTRELYYFPQNECKFYTDLMQTRDYHSEKNADITIPDNPRIIIVDNDSYIKDIKIRHIAYFAIYDSEKKSFILREGTNL